MEEIWKPIEGFEGFYKISNQGRVWACPRERSSRFGIILKTPLDNQRYCQVNLYGKTKKHMKVHRLVAMAFLPNPYNFPQVNHKNGVRHDNRVENLEWCTNQYNTQHGYTIGTHSKLKHSQPGEKHGMSVLKAKEVLGILRERKLGMSYKQLAFRYRVNYSTIWDIVNARSWTHIKRTP